MNRASVMNADTAVVLPDGRRLAYVEWGDPSGPPVFLFHGGAGSRYFNPSVSAEPAEQIRLFTIDRPGFGGSDQQPGRTLRGWAGDVSTFADALGIDRFAVVGYSDGGPHALACGVEIPERLTALGVVSGIAPISSDEDLDETEQRFFESAGLDPVAAVREYVAALRPTKDPTELLRGPLPEVERRFLDDAAIREMYERALREHAVQGYEGDAWEWLAIEDASWGFGLEDVACAVKIWHGRLDQIVPPVHPEYLVAHIPDVLLTWWPDEGHTGIMARWREVISALLAS